MKLLLLVLLNLFALPALAGPATFVWADGRFTVHSPQYYSSTTADLSVNLRADVPFGSSVTVRYGFGGTAGDWKNQQEVPARAAGPWEFRADFSGVLHERSWNGVFTKLEFVFIITQPDGSVRFEKGGDSVFGYYESALPEPGTITSESSLAFQRLVTYKVERN